MPGSGTALAELARFTANLRYEALPAPVACRAQACLLYGLAVGIASVGAPSPQIAAKALDHDDDGGHSASGATRLLDGKRTAAGSAAFANAVLLHARIQEDAHPAGHVGVVVVPAAMAVAEGVGASGDELLAAIAAGYECALRIGRDHVVDASARGFRSTPLYGVFGAAAAAARLLRLDTGQTLNALALAANAGAGLREFIQGGTEEYAYQAGAAARNGITTATLAAHSASAAPGSLDGPAGFFRAFGQPGKNYAERLTEGLGESYELLDVAYKPYPTCQFHRSLIRGVLDLRAKAGGAELEAMSIRMNPFEADFFGVRFAGPFSSFSQTFMSAPFCAALAWTAGNVTYRGLHAFQEPRVVAKVARIEVVSDPDRRRYQPEVTVRCKGLPPLSWAEPEGAGAFQLTWEAAVAMTRVFCAEAGVPEPLGLRLIAEAERLPTGANVRGVLEAFRVAADSARLQDASSDRSQATSR